MGIPTSYTVEMLRSYMVGRVANIAALLGLTPTHFDEAVNDALLAYGVTDIANVTSISKIRALAHLEAWRVIRDAASGEYQFAVDGGNYNRKQIFDNAQAILEKLEIQYAEFLPTDPNASGNDYPIQVGTVTYNDRYSGYYA